MEYLADISAWLQGTERHWESLLRLLVAAVLGAAIGLERERHGQGAGFRTMLLVGMGASLVMLVALEFASVFSGHQFAGVLRADVAGAITGIMGGVGFLGAGAIFRQGVGVRGLTTAASLWCTAAVGMACGFGMFAMAGVTTVIILFALHVLGKLEDLLPIHQRKAIVVVIPASSEAIEVIRKSLRALGAKISDTQVEHDCQRNEMKLTFNIVVSTRVQMQSLLQVAEHIPEVRHVAVL